MTNFFGSFGPSPLSLALSLALLVLAFGVPIALGSSIHRAGGNGLAWGLLAFVLGPFGWLIGVVSLISLQNSAEKHGINGA